MSSPLQDLIDSNRRWSASVSEADPKFFERLAKQQSPKYLWIGCSDSRVPATQIVDLPPGEIFVQRNVANVVSHTDLNCLSTIQFAVDVLKVEHIIVVGHYGCGGVQAVLDERRLGLVDNWLRHVGDVAHKHVDKLATLDSMPLRNMRLCELNAIEQVVNVCQTTILMDAWDRGQPLSVHAWCYSLSNGHMHDLGMHVSSRESLRPSYEQALELLMRRAKELR
ncbi:carbonate dehydratase [Dyella nitratireducens]|uniref:Carbonic anhydrase n=1 Tax=Dyella nitratireducens TaxID=1849580 RepID=A0ABQ1G3D5_9GAMM|nr:carbonate dehydratase [Dyella nitratireducens]GGA36609.1 carbonic anhydrase [Dyella nitratireducens]GLQ41090.1 carbonic anhydrase [Dyella nitratireducens]